MECGLITALAAGAGLLLSAGAAAADRLVNGEGRVAVGGVEHWYRIAGAENGGAPVVVVHGGPGGNEYAFERIPGPRLERFATVVYYEQRGSGRSAAPADETAYSMDLLASDLDGLLDALGVEKATLLGFSFGAELALEYAVRHPERVGKLVLSSAIAGDHERLAATQTWGWLAVQDDPAARARLESLAGQPVASAVDRLGEIWSLAGPEQVDRFLFHDPSAAAEIRRLDAESGLENTGLAAQALLGAPSRRSPSLMEDARSIRAPALVIGGLYDRNVGVDEMRDLAQALPDARLVVFEHSAHFPEIEEPDRYAQEIERFLEE